jgi:hypothetical protein
MTKIALSVVAIMLVCGCAHHLKRPENNTSAPSLGSAKNASGNIGKSVNSARDSVKQASVTNDTIDEKLVRLKSMLQEKEKPQ